MLLDLPCHRDAPLAALERLAPLRPRFLLESARGGRPARYSLLGLGGRLDVRLGPAGGLVVDGERRDPPRGRAALLDLLRRRMARAPRLGPERPGLPFLGGLVGAVGYRFARRLDRVCRAPGAPPPAGPELLLFAPEAVLAFDHLAGRVELLAPTGGERRALAREVRRLLAGPAPVRPARAARLGPLAPSLEAGAFQAGVRRALEAIAAGEVFQLVLSRRWSGPCDLDPLAVYRALRALSPSPYMAFLDAGDTVVVAASPEALVRLRGRSAFLQPIAGTRPRGRDEAEDRALEAELLADAKESAEHVMLVDLARNDLGRVALPGSVRVAPYRVVERFSHVLHTVSGVHGRLRPGADAFELFASAFPAGTVTGAPKLRAMELIDAIEPVDRGLYAGTIGFFGHGGRMDQALAIRAIFFGPGGRVALQAGAGIVAASRPAAELAEVDAKAAALVAALRAAAAGPVGAREVA